MKKIIFSFLILLFSVSVFGQYVPAYNFNGYVNVKKSIYVYDTVNAQYMLVDSLVGEKVYADTSVAPVGYFTAIYNTTLATNDVYADSIVSTYMVADSIVTTEIYADTVASPNGYITMLYNTTLATNDIISDSIKTNVVTSPNPADKVSMLFNGNLCGILSQTSGTFGSAQGKSWYDGYLKFGGTNWVGSMYMNTDTGYLNQKSIRVDTNQIGIVSISTPAYDIYKQNDLYLKPLGLVYRQNSRAVIVADTTGRLQFGDVKDADSTGISRGGYISMDSTTTTIHNNATQSTWMGDVGIHSMMVNGASQSFVVDVRWDPTVKDERIRSEITNGSGQVGMLCQAQGVDASLVGFSSITANIRNISIGNYTLPAYNEMATINITDSLIKVKGAIVDVPADTGVSGVGYLINDSVGITSYMVNAGKVILCQGNSGPVDVVANPQIATPTNYGHIIEIWGTDDTNTLTLDDGDGLQLKGGASVTLGAGDNIVLRFMYINGARAWREISRSDN